MNLIANSFLSKFCSVVLLDRTKSNKLNSTFCISCSKIPIVLLDFKLIFPSDYPFSPPKVFFLTNDSICRYHPNLYKNGKCCLSILNTWEGEQWTSCQTILSILLTISSILQNNPLILEPGIKLSHPDVNRYNDIITYKKEYLTHTKKKNKRIF